MRDQSEGTKRGWEYTQMERGIGVGLETGNTTFSFNNFFTGPVS